MPRLVAALLIAAVSAALAQTGDFEASSDVGATPLKGSAQYDAATREYRITGGGANMWGATDAFHFAWKRLSGDVRMTAEVRFVGTSAQAHRKAGLIVRQSLDPGSPYAHAVVHGDGLTSLQFRSATGGETREAKSALSAPVVIRIERRGDLFTMWAGPRGGPLQPAGPVPVELGDPVYVGLAVCSHDAATVETAVFSNVSVESLPPFEPFPMEWRGERSLADVSHLLEAPAGKHGFITVRNGHLVKGNGERFRIWGINATAAATVPAKEDAPAVAVFLARFGINCVRFHFLDLPAPSGLLDPKRDDTQAFDAERLDRLDYFVAELKKRGVYTNLNLNVGRRYKAGDGVRDYELLGYAKALTYFDERLLELQRDHARKLLTHRNPYTNSEYRNEPAVAIVELVNENSIVESWFSNRLLGKNTRKNPGTWTDIPESYERALTEKYNAWLASTLDAATLAKMREAAGVPEGALVPRLRRNEFEAAPALRFHTEARFYMQLEADYFRMMRDLLKKELGVKSLIAATSDHNHSATGYPLLRSTSLLDIVDGHTYWQHPSYVTDPATGRTTGFSIPNTPMVNDPRNSSVVELSRSAVAGKPYTVSEVNHPFPAEYAAEGIPILAAYGALHDWDGIFWYTLDHSEPSKWTPKQPSHFEFRPDPVKMTQVAAGALCFLRGDVRPAGRTVTRSYSEEQVIESLRLPRTERPYFTPGFPALLPLRHASRIASLDRAGDASYPEIAGEPLASDTGELAWHDAAIKAGVVTIDAPRTQGIVGFCNANPKETKHLAAAVSNTFCAVTVASLDGKPVAAASRLLLNTASRAANSGMKWNPARTTLADWGSEPSVIEPVKGFVTLKALAGAKRVTATALDTAGRAIGAPVTAERTTEGWRLPLGVRATAWYLVQVGR